ncbi:MAG: DVU0524 family FlgM-associated protein [Desulfobacterales bacterium]
MYITNYQMNNVLKVYTSQLSKCRAPVPDSLAVRKPTSDAIDISTEGRRQNLIERIASDIVARIRNGGSRNNRETRITENLNEESKGPSRAPKSRNAQFIYNVIRGEAEKKTNTLSVEDADSLARRFEELVRKMMDHSARSSSV